MLAVTAGDGACGENNTQPTARVSTLTALSQKQRVFDSDDTRDGPDDDVHQQTKLLLAARGGAIILLPAPETHHVLSASLGQLAELSGEVVQHSNVVKPFQFYRFSSMGLYAGQLSATLWRVDHDESRNPRWP